MRHAFPDHMADELLEQYALGKLGESDFDDVGDHLLLCPQCRRRLADISIFVSGPEEAAKKLVEPGPIRTVFYRLIFKLPAFLLILLLT